MSSEERINPQSFEGSDLWLDFNKEISKKVTLFLSERVKKEVCIAIQNGIWWGKFDEVKYAFMEDQFRFLTGT